MEIAISLELGTNVNVFEFYVDSLMSSLFSLTSSIAIASTRYASSTLKPSVLVRSLTKRSCLARFASKSLSKSLANVAIISSHAAARDVGGRGAARLALFFFAASSSASSAWSVCVGEAIGQSNVLPVKR